MDQSPTRWILHVIDRRTMRIANGSIYETTNATNAFKRFRAHVVTCAIDVGTAYEKHS